MNTTQQPILLDGWLYFSIDPQETWAVRQWLVDHVGPAASDFSAKGIGWLVHLYCLQTPNGGLVAGVQVDPEYVGSDTLMAFQLIWT